MRFHRGLSLICHREADDAVYSLSGDAYAEYSSGEIKLFGDGNDLCEKTGDFTLCDRPGILSISVCPGEAYDHDLTKRNAVILRPYHSGTLNTESKAFRDFCARASSLGIPVYVINVSKGETYASSKEFDSLGIRPIYSSAFISVYVRLWIAISRQEPFDTVF